MLFRAPTVLTVALFASYVLATPSPKKCQPGEWRDNNGDCHECANGYISPNGDDTGNPYTCSPCPAGQSSNPAHTECQKCSPGNYNDVVGGVCRECQDGFFNNVSGAKSCCQCCAGFYTNGPKTHCNQCNQNEPYSFPGSTSNDDCKDADHRGGRPDPADDCKMVADNVCPNPTGTGPIGTAITRKKRQIHCTKGFQSCPNYTGRGGFECVDTKNDPESCGGCVSFDGNGSGTDCTAMEGVSITRCVKGSCVIDSCGKGYAKSSDGSSCTLVSSTDGSNPEVFSSQNGGATSKRGSPAKRVVRGRVF